MSFFGKNFIKVFLWLLIFTILLNWSFNLLNEPSSIANIIGAIIIAFNAWLTAETKCFTSIHFRKNKKD